MLACHLHFLDAVGRVIRTERLEASSDEQATMIAEERMGAAALDSPIAREASNEICRHDRVQI